jgi:hypothetical protein
MVTEQWHYRGYLITLQVNSLQPDKTNSTVYLAGEQLTATGAKAFSQAKHYINQWLGNRLFIRKRKLN